MAKPQTLFLKEERSFRIEEGIYYNVPKGAFLLEWTEGIPEMPSVGEDTPPQRGERAGWFFTLGWNGSFHECTYQRRLLVWAKGAHRMGRARRLLKKLKCLAAQEAAEQQTRRQADSARMRLLARRYVRPGD